MVSISPLLSSRASGTHAGTPSGESYRDRLARIARQETPPLPVHLDPDTLALPRDHTGARESSDSLDRAALMAGELVATLPAKLEVARHEGRTEIEIGRVPIQALREEDRVLTRALESFELKMRDLCELEWRPAQDGVSLNDERVLLAKIA